MQHLNLDNDIIKAFFGNIVQLHFLIVGMRSSKIRYLRGYFVMKVKRQVNKLNYACHWLRLYAGLEIISVASQNANHFWGNCESLWQSESQIANHFKLICEPLFKWYRQKTFFVLTSFEGKNFYFFRHILCMWCKNANTLRITNHFAKVCRHFAKMANHFSFLKSSLGYTNRDGKSNKAMKYKVLIAFIYLCCH